MSPLQLAFDEWDRAHPEIYRQFLRIALEMLAAGKQRGSGWDVVNQMRWHGKPVKISNDFIACLTRKAIAEHPELAGFFTLKPAPRLEETAADVDSQPRLF